MAESSYDKRVSPWRRTTEVNPLGTANVTYQMGHMIEAEPADGCPQGRFVSVGSSGAYCGEPDAPAYGASKTAGRPPDDAVTCRRACTARHRMRRDCSRVHRDRHVRRAARRPAGQAIRAQSPFGRVATTREVALAIRALAGLHAE